MICIGKGRDGLGLDLEPVDSEIFRPSDPVLCPTYDIYEHTQHI